jgi:dynein heavy chain 1
VSKNFSLVQWIADLNARLLQVDSIAKEGFEDRHIWLGGLFISEAFVTATRQAIAQRNGWSLEELTLAVDLEKHGDAGSFTLLNLRMEGARWHEEALQLTTESSTRLGLCQMRWIKKAEAVHNEATTVPVPVYLNSDRSALLFNIRLNAKAEEHNIIAQRGIAIILSQ